MDLSRGLLEEYLDYRRRLNMGPLSPSAQREVVWVMEFFMEVEWEDGEVKDWECLARLLGRVMTHPLCRAGSLD